jgi:hypothetical protein
MSVSSVASLTWILIDIAQTYRLSGTGADVEWRFVDGEEDRGEVVEMGKLVGRSINGEVDGSADSFVSASPRLPTSPTSSQRRLVPYDDQCPLSENRPTILLRNGLVFPFASILNATKFPFT